MKIRDIFGLGNVVLAAALAGFAAQTARADRLPPDVVNSFPQNLGEFAYADLKAARSQKTLGALEVHFLPEPLAKIQSVLSTGGIDLVRQADGVAWGFTPASGYSAGDSQSAGIAPASEQIVGIAICQCNPESAEGAFKRKKLPSIEIAGQTVYALQSSSGPNDLFVAFLDFETLAFGQRFALEQMLEVRARVTVGLVANTELYRLINEVNGSGVLWAVLDSKYTQSTVRQISPELQQFAQSAKLFKSVKNIVLKLDADGGLDGQFQMVLASTDDANAMGQLMQLGLLYEGYEAKEQQNTLLSTLLTRAQIFPSGDRVTLRLSVNDDEAASLPQVLSAAN